MFGGRVDFCFYMWEHTMDLCHYTNHGQITHVKGTFGVTERAKAQLR